MIHLDCLGKDPPIASVAQSAHLWFKLANLITLYGQLEKAKNRVNLPSIITRIRRPSIHSLIAADNCVAEARTQSRSFLMAMRQISRVWCTSFTSMPWAFAGTASTAIRPTGYLDRRNG